MSQTCACSLFRAKTNEKDVCFRVSQSSSLPQSCANEKSFGVEIVQSSEPLLRSFCVPYGSCWCLLAQNVWHLRICNCWTVEIVHYVELSALNSGRYQDSSFALKNYSASSSIGGMEKAILLPPHGFRPEVKSRGGTLVARAYIKDSTYSSNMQSVYEKKSRFARTGAARNR